MILSFFIHFKLYTDCQNQDFLSCSDSDLEQNQNEMRFFLMRWDRISFFLMRWDRIRFFFSEMRQNWIFFCEMRQNQIFFLWDETESDFFSWNEIKQKMRAVLMKWNQIFMKQNILFWFFYQSINSICSEKISFFVT